MSADEGVPDDPLKLALTDTDVRGQWTEPMRPDEVHKARPIQLLTRDGTVYIDDLPSGAMAARIHLNGAVVARVNLKQCGALIEALCEAEWYLIGPTESGPGVIL